MIVGLVYLFSRSLYGVLESSFLVHNSRFGVPARYCVKFYFISGCLWLVCLSTWPVGSHFSTLDELKLARATSGEECDLPSEALVISLYNPWQIIKEIRNLEQ